MAKNPEASAHDRRRLIYVVFGVEIEAL